jgi:hypothetical protein
MQLSDDFGIYQGEVQNNYPHGSGSKHYYSPQMIFSGLWQNGLKIEGFLQIATLRYNVEFSQGFPFRLNGIYGHLLHSCPSGLSTIKFTFPFAVYPEQEGFREYKIDSSHPDGCDYYAVFNNGKISFKGKLLRRNRKIRLIMLKESEEKYYIGEGVGCRAYGFGKIHNEEWKYIGEVADGIPHGKGKKTHYHGLIQDGEFENGNFIHGNTRKTSPKAKKPARKPCCHHEHIRKHESHCMNSHNHHHCQHNHASNEIPLHTEPVFRNFPSRSQHPNMSAYELSLSSSFPSNSLLPPTTFHTFLPTGHFFGEPNLNFSSYKGLISLTKGGFYSGCWKNDCFDGVGKYVYPDGSVYVGEFEKGKRSGVGVLRGNGMKYQGQWANDMQNGKGKAYFNGYVYEGHWREGKIQSTMRIYPGFQ